MLAKFINLIKLCIGCQKKLKLLELPDWGVKVSYKCQNSSCGLFDKETTDFEMSSETNEVDIGDPVPLERKKVKPVQESLF